MVANFLVSWGEDFIKIWDIEVGELRTKQQINKYSSTYEINEQQHSIKQLLLMGNDLGSLNILIIKHNGDLDVFNFKVNTKLPSQIRNT